MDYLRGHRIEHNGKEWVYSDTKEPTADTWQNRPCGHCGRHNTLEGHDGCLGTLPGVTNACCGHGHSIPYVQAGNEFTARGKYAEMFFERMKSNE